MPQISSPQLVERLPDGSATFRVTYGEHEKLFTVNPPRDGIRATTERISDELAQWIFDITGHRSNRCIEYIDKDQADALQK